MNSSLLLYELSSGSNIHQQCIHGKMNKQDLAERLIHYEVHQNSLTDLSPRSDLFQSLMAVINDSLSMRPGGSFILLCTYFEFQNCFGIALRLLSFRSLLVFLL